MTNAPAATATESAPANRTHAASQSKILSALKHNGFAVWPQAAPAGFAERARALTEAAIAAQDPAAKAAHRALGSLLKLDARPGAAELALEPALVAGLAGLGLGLAPLCYHEAICFNKPPHSPPTFWHQDFPFWNDPVAMADFPHHLMTLWYLQDTRPENGCLRVIPGSHRRRHPLHDFWNFDSDAARIAVRDRLRRGEDPDSPAVADLPEAVDVPVRAGDVVLMDSRLLHGARANDSAAERTALTFWYGVDITAFAPGSRARLAREIAAATAGWPESVRAWLAPRLPADPGGPALALDNIPRLGR